MAHLIASHFFFKNGTLEVFQEDQHNPTKHKGSNLPPENNKVLLQGAWDETGTDNNTILEVLFL